MCCSLDAHLSQKRKYTAFICWIFNKNRSACPILSLFHYQIKYQILCDQDVKYVRCAHSHLGTRSMYCWRDPISKNARSCHSIPWYSLCWYNTLIKDCLFAQYTSCSHNSIFFSRFFSCHISCHLSHLWKHQSFHFLQSAAHSWISTPRYFF